MASDFKWTIENNDAIQRKFDELAKVTSDFTIPFRLIASDFYRSQKQIFGLKSEGLYAPLGGFNYNSPSGFGTQSKRDRAEAMKERRTGHAWAPILFGETGNLKDSTLKRSHRYSIFNLDKQLLKIGTSVPYGRYHQEGTKKMAQRKFIFITGGQGDKSKDSGINGRRERWTFIIDEHLKQIVTGKI